MTNAQHTVWVVSPSKLCNLRCSYCYEWSELGNPARMSLSSLRQLLVNVRDYHLELAGENPRVTTNISWLGGEPLLLPLDYLEDIMRMEHEIFGELLASRRIYNVVQSNLYKLDDAHLDFIARHAWKLGISLDVMPGVRRSLNGRATEARVMENVARVRARGIQPDPIAVLAGHTVGHLREVYDFFAANGFTRLRILPLFSGPPDRPLDGVLATNEAMADALCDLFLHWLRTGSRLALDPIVGYLTAVTRKILDLPSPMYDRARDGEAVLVINTNGDAYQVIDAYEPDLAMGNVATTPISEILTSDAMLRSRRRDAARVRAMCGPCSYAGYCTGGPAFESPREGTDEGRCQIHHRVHHFIERYLRDSGFDAPTLRQLLEVHA